MGSAKGRFDVEIIDQAEFDRLNGLLTDLDHEEPDEDDDEARIAWYAKRRPLVEAQRATTRMNTTCPAPQGQTASPDTPAAAQPVRKIIFNDPLSGQIERLSAVHAMVKRRRSFVSAIGGGIALIGLLAAPLSPADAINGIKFPSLYRYAGPGPICLSGIACLARGYGLQDG